MLLLLLYRALVSNGVGDPHYCMPLLLQPIFGGEREFLRSTCGMDLGDESLGKEGPYGHL